MKLGGKIAAYVLAAAAFIFGLLELLFACMKKEYGDVSGLKAMDILGIVLMMLTALGVVGIVLLMQVTKKNNLIGIIDFALAVNFIINIIVQAINMKHYESYEVGYIYVPYIFLFIIFAILAILCGVCMLIKKFGPFVLASQAAIFGYLGITALISGIQMMFNDNLSTSKLGIFQGWAFTFVSIIMLIAAQSMCSNKNNEA